MFYLWRIDNLKSELAAGSLPAAAGLRYLVALGIVSWLDPTLLPLEESGPYNRIDYIGTGASLLVFIAGTVACYQANLGERGRDFVSRYVSLLWVLGIRWTIMVFIPVIISVIAMEDLAGEIPEDTSALEGLAMLVVFVGFFFRLRHHFTDLARTAEAS